MILQIIFGLTHGSLSVWLRFSRRMIVKVLLTHEDAVVRLPTADEATLFATMINQKYPLIKNFWGAMDGLRLTLQRAGNETQQNNFYNGWTHEQHYVTNLFLFSPDGKIRCSYFNALVFSMTPPWQFGHRSMIKLKWFTGIQVKKCCCGFSISI